MHEEGEEVYEDRDMPLLQVHVSQVADATTVAGCASGSRHVLMYPLLRQYSDKSYRQTKREASEPEAVGPENRLTGSEGGRDVDGVWDDHNALGTTENGGPGEFGDLVHVERISLVEVGLEALVSITNEGGDDG